MKSDDKNDVFGLGLFSEDGEDLFQRMEKARELGLPTDDGEGIRETLAALLEWFEEKGREGLEPILSGPRMIPRKVALEALGIECDSDSKELEAPEMVEWIDASEWLRYRPDKRIEDATHRQLEHAARYLRSLVFEKAAEDEMDHIYFFDEGLDEDMSESVADSIRHQQETVALVALELGILAAEAGLKPHLTDLEKGKKFRPPKTRTDDLGKCIGLVLDDLGDDAKPSTVWDELMKRAEGGHPPFDVIIPDENDPERLCWKRGSNHKEETLSFESFKRRLDRQKKKRRTLTG